MIQFNISLLFTIINLLVLYLLMRKFLFGPIMRVMDKRQTIIEEGLGNARKSQKEAEELKEKYDENLRQVHVECEALLSQAKERAIDIRIVMLENAQKKYSSFRKRQGKTSDARKSRRCASSRHRWRSWRWLRL